MALLGRRLKNLPMKAILLAICAALGLASESDYSALMGTVARGMARSLVAALTLFLAPLLASAQSMDPRAYANLPVGLNFLLAGYTYLEGELGFDASSPLQDGRTRVHALPVGYVRSLEVFGKAGNLALAVPFVDL